MSVVWVQVTFFIGCCSGDSRQNKTVLGTKAGSRQPDAGVHVAWGVDGASIHKRLHPLLSLLPVEGGASEMLGELLS